MAKISIIVPVYKAEYCIKKCAESLMSQTMKDIEIILVDDGSPDNSGKICDELAFQDNRIKVIHKENGGVSSARNRGIEEATGEYILFVDSDDWVEADYAESLYDLKMRHPDCEAICGFRTVSGYEGTITSTVVYKNNEAESDVKLCDYMNLVEMWLSQSPWNKLFRKKIIENENIRFSKDLSLGEDAVFNLEYFLKCGNQTIKCINRPLYNYMRTEKDSLSNTYYPDILEIDKRLFTLLKKCITIWGASEVQINKFNNSHFYRFVYALDNTYRTKNTASSREKRRTNNAILRSKEFKTALSKVTSYIHPIHKLAYKSGSWNLVRLAYKLSSLKNKITKGK